METEIERAKKSIKDYRKSYGQNQLSTDCIIQLMIEHSRTEQLILPVVVRQSEQLCECEVQIADNAIIYHCKTPHNCPRWNKA